MDIQTCGASCFLKIGRDTRCERIFRYAGMNRIA